MSVRQVKVEIVGLRRWFEDPIRAEERRDRR